MMFILALLLPFFSLPAQAQTCQELFSTTKMISDVTEIPPMKEVPLMETAAIFKEADPETVRLATDFRDEVTKLQKKLRFWTRVTGGKERDYLFELRERRQLFDFYLKSTGDVMLAVAVYADIFRDVEDTYFALNHYYNSPKKRYFVSPRAKAMFRRFGENYGDYMFVRHYLENLASKDPATLDEPGRFLQNRAKDALKKLGPVTVSKRFKDLDGTDFSTSDRAPTIAELRDFWHAHSEPLIYKLKRDVMAERFFAVKLFIGSTLQLQKIRSFIFKVLPPAFRSPVSSFLGLNYNSYVLRKYLPDIEMIIFSPEASRFRTFSEVYARHHQNSKSVEFLTTFARIISKNKQWQELRLLVQNDTTLDKTIVERMTADINEAEANLAKMTYLSDFYKPSIVDHYAAWGAGGLMAVGTTYYYGGFEWLGNAVSHLF